MSTPPLQTWGSKSRCRLPFLVGRCNDNSIIVLMKVKPSLESATTVENPGHPWRECKKPLKPTLKLALIVENERKAVLADKKGLNQTGGTGVKGGRIPKATPAAAQK